MALFKILKGDSSNFATDLSAATVAPPWHNGYCYYVEDNGKLYIDWLDGEEQKRTCLNAEYADKLKGSSGLPAVPATPVAEDEEIPYSWEEINAIALSGHATDWISVGAIKSVTLSEEVLGTTTHDVRVIGINQDNDQSITFQTKNCLTNSTYFDYYTSAAWINSAARNLCRSYYNVFPGKDAIKIVSKGTCPNNSTGSSRSDAVTYNDETVWLPSEREMGLDYLSPLSTANSTTSNAECTKGKNFSYAYYTSDDSRVKKRGDSGNVNYYWERSRFYNDLGGVCVVTSEGKANSNTRTTPDDGLAPAFVIGNEEALNVVPDLTAEDIISKINEITPEQIGAVSKSGDTMTGNLDINNSNIHNIIGVDTNQDIPIAYVQYYDSVNNTAANIGWNNGDLFYQPTDDLISWPKYDILHTGMTPTTQFAQKNLTLYDGVTSRTIITALGDGDDKDYGSETIIGGGGNLFIGSGEAPTNLQSLLVDGGATVANEYYARAKEQTYICSDQSVMLEANCNTVADRKCAIFNSSGNFIVPGSITGSTVNGAVWNDYAEYRSADSIEPGRCVVEGENGILHLSTSRLQPGANIISDTFGFSIGETENCKTPIAVAGRVLVYTNEERESYPLGAAVCSGPNGTVSLMTREEIREYPERIIGTVSEIPTYEFWGSGNVKVNNRIWIKVR